MVPEYGWKAPAWTGAETYPVLYDDHEGLLFHCALLEEGLPTLEQHLQSLRKTEANNPFADDFVLAPRAERLLKDIPALFHKVEAVLAERRTSIEAGRAKEDAHDGIIMRALGLVKGNGVPDEQANEMVSLSLSTGEPQKLVEWLGLTLGQWSPAALLDPVMQEITQLLSEYDKAHQALRAERPSQERWEEAGRLEQHAWDLCGAMYSLIPMRARLVPRAGPDQGDQGHVLLDFAALLQTRHFVRVLAAADAVLWHEHPSPTGDLRASILNKRQWLLEVVERHARAAVAWSSRHAAEMLESQLMHLCIKVAEHFHQPFPRTLPDYREWAAELLTTLVDNPDPLARVACARLTTLLAAPGPRSEHPPEVSATQQDFQVAMELEMDLARWQRMESEDQE